MPWGSNERGNCSNCSTLPLTACLYRSNSPFETLAASQAAGMVPWQLAVTAGNWTGIDCSVGGMGHPAPKWAAEMKGLYAQHTVYGVARGSNKYFSLRIRDLTPLRINQILSILLSWPGAYNARVSDINRGYTPISSEIWSFEWIDWILLLCAWGILHHTNSHDSLENYFHVKSLCLGTTIWRGQSTNAYIKTI